MISALEFAEDDDDDCDVDDGSGLGNGRSDVFSEGGSGLKVKPSPKLALAKVLLVEKTQLSCPSGDRCQVEPSLS